MQIRQLTSGDLEQFKVLRAKGLKESPEAFGASPSDFSSKSNDEIVDMLSSHNRGEFVLGVFVSNSLVGVAGFRTHPFEKMAHKGTIWGMYVEPGHRRNGLGRLLLTTVIEKASALPKIRQLNLTVVVDNIAAKELYLSEGFHVCGTEQAALKVNERFYDEHFMQRNRRDT